MLQVLRESLRVLRESLPAVGAALSMTVIFVVVLTIPLGVAEDIPLTAAELTAWVIGVYGVAGLLGFVLVARYRQPLVLTGNVFIIIFVASLGGRLSWSELTAASMLAGGLVLVVGLLGATERLAAWLPAPIVFGVLAGAVLPFFLDLFAAFGAAPAVVGGAFVVYLLGRRFLEPRLPAILPALVAGLVIAGLGGDIAAAPAAFTWPVPALTPPTFSFGAVITATPVMVVLIALQANVPSIVFLRSERFDPPERTVSVVSGAGTMLGSLLGPIGISLSLPSTALAAGGDAGPHRIRHRSAYLAAGSLVMVALLAGVAADVAAVVPRALLLAVVGLAVISVLLGALQQVVHGPLVLGPLFAFGLALSDVTLFGLGPFFWALAVGLTVSLLLERDGWRELGAEEDAGDE